MESVISNEISHFIERIESANGAAIDLEKILPTFTTNIVAVMMFGERFDYCDKKLDNLQFGKIAGMNMQTRFFPFVKVGLSKAIYRP